jgi:hypothetical protein
VVDPEQKLFNEIDRGVHAKRILNDELVKEARERCEAWIVENFKSAPQRDKEGVSYLHDLWKTQARFFQFFEAVLTGGETAEKHLEMQRRGVTAFLGDVWKSRQSRR